MKLTDERLIGFLEKRLQGKVSIDKFLNPIVDDIRPAKNLKNMDLAVEKIREAIKNKKRILIFGDYDADGVCASAVLYLFLKSQGVEAQVFIPNRFEMGYGISVEAIDEIEFEYSPNLVITVDLGVTAIEEVEILKQEGIETVITDHHIPLDEIPDTIVVDPKIDPDGTYGFDGICGAGVAFKLVEALSSREEAMKYIDIVAIATVGDIVPLVDENRAIAKIGIDKINSEDCVPSIKYLKKQLKLEKITSSDISFKIVPRLNACGRMSSAKKSFDFLVETDEKLLQSKYLEMELDNNLRLSAIETGSKKIEKFMESYDISLPAILIDGEFNEGVLGILASRVLSEYKKPTIIFSKTLNQTYKGSGRSPSGIDIHEVITKISGLLENFGGHKMACGLEVSVDNFEEFKKAFMNELSNETVQNESVPDEFDEAIVVTDDDFNLNFMKQVNLLEPFGFGNEKPLFCYECENLKIEQISDKGYKHYKLFTKKCNMVLAFSGKDEAEICAKNGRKKLLVDFLSSEYKGRENLNVTLKNIKIENISFGENEEESLTRSLFLKYNSIFDIENREKYHLTEKPELVIKEKFESSDFGTIAVVSSDDDLKKLEKLGIDVYKYISIKPPKNGKNTILVGSQKLVKSMLKGYQNIIFLHRYFEEENLCFSEKLDVYEPLYSVPYSKTFDLDRNVFAEIFKVLLNCSNLLAEDEFVLAKKVAVRSGFSYFQVMLCMLTFFELNFIEFDEILCHLKPLKAKKTELSESKIYSLFVGGE